MAKPDNTQLYNPVKFSVYRNATWNSGNGAFALVPFDTKNFDTGSNVDVVTNKGRFTAPLTGFYFISFNLQTGASDSNLIASIFKNGVEFRRFRYNAATASGSGISGTDLISLTATDYLEIFCFATATTVMDSAVDRTFFSGYLVSTT
jgi:hypothetical protein